MLNSCVYVWAKTGGNEDLSWHPLLLHMLDVAACADAILNREPESTRRRMGELLGLQWEDACPWLLLAIACHDLGKACPGFQCKWKNMTNLDEGRSPNTGINHAFVSQISLADILRGKGWNIESDASDSVADAIGCHHGMRASPKSLDDLAGDGRAIGNDTWKELRQNIVDALLEVFNPKKNPIKYKLSGPDFMLLSGLTSFSDWIGSNREYFPFGGPEDCVDLKKWFEQRKENANQALDAIGWRFRTSLYPEKRSFEQIFPKLSPRPLQRAIIDALSDFSEPGILLVEAPMGEGKTEAAFFAYTELQRRFGHRGLYVALPTKATGNAMFSRTLAFLSQLGTNRILDMQLMHGGGLLNETFQVLRISGIYDPETGGGVRAGEWFTDKKRALLSEYGVGTVDQALLPILPVRHQFVRLWGLANRVVVFDEIHAYDAYTGTLLLHLLRWLLALGSSVILLSATLPPSIRKKISKVGESGLPEPEVHYPRISLFRPGKNVLQKHFEPDPARHLSVSIHGIPADLPRMADALNEYFDRGMGLVLVNTVQRAQEFYRLFPDGEVLEQNGVRVGKKLPDGTEIFLFHARYPGDRRQKREELVLNTFGINSCRDGRKILIATQVAEQSLDLDFDLIVTDLAPIDLILQRAGRLWRHARPNRPVSEPTLLIASLDEDTPPSFGKPLWWDSVYREDILLRTWLFLKPRQSLTLPNDIDDSVRMVYEDQVIAPEYLLERMEKALISEEGETMAHMGQANLSIIGFPDDASWNDPARFVLYDEDNPTVHRSLMAQTRLGEDSVLAIPLSQEDSLAINRTLDFSQEKQWYMKSVSLSRKGVIKKLKEIGVPDHWKASSLLRNCFPLILDKNGRWTEDTKVRLDNDLGIVYEVKEAN